MWEGKGWWNLNTSRGPTHRPSLQVVFSTKHEVLAQVLQESTPEARLRQSGGVFYLTLSGEGLTEFLETHRSRMRFRKQQAGAWLVLLKALQAIKGRKVESQGLARLAPLVEAAEAADPGQRRSGGQS